MRAENKPNPLAQAILGFVAMALVSGCAPDAASIFLPAGDIRPPVVIAASQEDSASFRIDFDEEVVPVGDSFVFSPSVVSVRPEASESSVVLSLSPSINPGEACSLAGEVRDKSGNTTRFLFSFVGYNERPATLILNEIQTGKNAAISNLHRDYMEFLVHEGGNLGAVHLQWASFAKIMEYTFPPAEVRAGDIIVLHCAPEGLPAEVDEKGGNLGLSGGVDASPAGRDFWTIAGGIPDETGLIIVRPRAEESPNDGFFYAAADRTGPIESGKFTELLAELQTEGIWTASTPPLWSEAFQWKSSASRPLHRGSSFDSPTTWMIGEAGTQSPGKLAPGAIAPGAKKPRSSKSGKTTTDGKK